MLGLSCKSLIAPWVATISAAVKLAPASSSLNKKLITAVSPDFSPATLRLMLSVGGSMSMTSVGVSPAPPGLP